MNKGNTVNTRKHKQDSESHLTEWEAEMACKHVRGCAASLAIRKMHLKPQCVDNALFVGVGGDYKCVLILWKVIKVYIYNLRTFYEYHISIETFIYIRGECGR